MNTKRCSKCKVERPIEKFSKNKSRKDGLHSSCKPCHNQYLKSHYEKRKEYYIEKAKRHNTKYREEHTKFIRELKENTPCTDCGQNYPYYVMDFDHLDPKTKLENIGWMTARRLGIETIKKEISKCEIVCSNCHRIRTHKLRPSTGLVFETSEP